MRKTKLITILTLITLTTLSCATFQTNAYKTLYISKSVYDTYMKIAADLYAQGKLTEEQKSTIINLGNNYTLAHNEAVSMLKVALSTGSEEDKENYIKSLHLASSILSKIISIIQPLVEQQK